MTTEATKADRLAEIKAAHETVMPGYAYTREHFHVDPATFVGHTPARIYEDALEVVLEGVPWLIAEVERLRAGLRTLVDATHAFEAGTPPGRLSEIGVARAQAIDALRRAAVVEPEGDAQ